MERREFIKAALATVAVASLQKIVILNGSPRPFGNTKSLINAFTEGAKSKGHEVIFLICNK